MKIDAEVELSDSKEEDLGESFVKVPVDSDYVEGNADSVKEWVRNELERRYGEAFCDEDFTIANLDDVVEDIASDEFERRTAMADAGRGAGEIPEIDPELFTYGLYEMNFGDRLGLYHRVYPEVFEFEHFIEVLRPRVVGWCDPSRLAVRPKAEGVALMCEDEGGERFWFHALDKTAEALGIKGAPAGENRAAALAQ